MNYINKRAFEIFEHAHGGGIPTAGDIDLYRIYAVLSFAKGESTTLEDVHDAWSAWTAAHRPEHRSLIPFAELAPDVQEMDRRYMEAIHRVAATLV